MNDIIEQYYLDNNYPNSDKLYKILKKNNINIPLAHIKEWMKLQQVEQIMKPVINKTTGHIVAFKENEFWNIDIFDLSKYYKYNKGYKYIFCAIDIFTRKVYCISMKNKDNNNVSNAINIDNIIMPYNKPIRIMIISDSDSTLLSKKNEDFLKL